MTTTSATQQQQEQQSPSSSTATTTNNNNCQIVQIGHQSSISSPLQHALTNGGNNSGNSLQHASGHQLISALQARQQHLSPLGQQQIQQSQQRVESFYNHATTSSGYDHKGNIK